MSNVIGDICFPVGSYTDQQGNEKKRWHKCGILMLNNEGKYRIKLDSIPLGVQPDGGWFAVFSKDENPAAPQPAPKPAPPPAPVVGPDEDIPF